MNNLLNIGDVMRKSVILLIVANIVAIFFMEVSPFGDFVNGIGIIVASLLAVIGFLIWFSDIDGSR